jgi:fused signal recognition particle receptor
MAFFGLFGRKREAAQEAADRQALEAGLERSREGLFGRLTRAIAGKSTIDDEVLDHLEEVLVSSDVGVETTLRIIDRVQERVKRDKYVSTSELNGILRDEVAALMKDPAPVDPAIKPYVIMVVGVNGVGRPPPSASWPTPSRRRAAAWCWAPPIPSAPPQWTSCASGASAWVCPWFNRV